MLEEKEIGRTSSECRVCMEVGCLSTILPISLSGEDMENGIDAHIAWPNHSSKNDEEKFGGNR